jgi:hypothetical protein
VRDTAAAFVESVAMPLRLAALAYPVGALVGAAMKNQVVGTFAEAEAFDEKTARKPASLGASQIAVQKAVKKGVMVSCGDGRFYVDRKAARRRFLRFALLWVVLPTALVGALFFSGLV